MGKLKLEKPPSRWARDFVLDKVVLNKWFTKLIVTAIIVNASCSAVEAQIEMYARTCMHAHIRTHMQVK